MDGGQAEHNKRAIQTMHAAITGGDPMRAFAVMLDLFDPDVVVHEPASLPYGGIYKGRDEFLGLMGPAMGLHFDAPNIRLERIVADEDNVVVRWAYPWRASAD